MVQIEVRNSKIEGECIILETHAVKYLKPLHWFIVGFSLLFLGLPLLFFLWFPKLKRMIYFQDCELDDATHIWVVHADKYQQPVLLQYGALSLSLSQRIHTYFFTCRFMKYYLHAEVFTAVEYSYSEQLKNMKSETIGLTHTQAQQHFDTFGQGHMEFEKTTFCQLVYIEVTKPFFLFVVFCFIQMCLTDYVAFGSCVLAFSIIATIMTVCEYMTFEKQLQEKISPPRDLPVYRNRRIMQISTKYIVPGDVVFVKDLGVPFDGIILEGSVLIDQSELTGQSFPVSKKEISIAEYTATNKVPGESVLFEGTKFIQCHNNSHPIHKSLGVGMLVTLTGFSSYKGQILRTIKFPKNNLVQFQRQAFLFVFAIFILVVVTDTLLFRILTQDPWFHSKYLRLVLMALVIAVPPQLPTCMNVAAAFSQRRLRKQGVSSNNLSKIIENGRVNMICFDKTGTLTRKDVQFEGYLPNRQNFLFQNQEMLGSQNRHKFFQLESQSSEVQIAAKAFACCHSLEFVKEKEKVDGDPIETQLFKFGGYHLDSDYLGDDQFGSVIARVRRTQVGTKKLDMLIVRRFEFNSDDKKMSTVCADQTNNKIYIFTKGSPQSLSLISKTPNGFHEVLSQYTKKGLRVLAIAYKEIKKSQASTILRKEAENDLTFLGLVIFENKLKIDAPDIIATLMKNKFRCVMLTGDNKQTAQSIAKQLNFNPEEVRARCTPQQKSTYVEEFKKQGYKVMMCGDGVNDLLALKTAHIGFGVDGGWGMDFIGPLEGVLHLLEEGRASIVAGVAMVKIIVTYALLEFIAQTIAGLLYADLHNAHYIYLDVVLDIIPVMLLPLAKPKPLTLARPYASILNYPTYVGIFVPVITGLLISLIFVYKDEYKEMNMAINALDPSGDANKCNIAVTQLFIIASGLTCGTLTSMDWKYTWRKENYILIVYAIVGWGLLHIVPFVPFLKEFFAMGDQNSKIIFMIVLVTDIAVVLTVYFEKMIVYRLAEHYVEKSLNSSDPTGPHPMEVQLKEIKRYSSRGEKPDPRIPLLV